MPALRRVTTGAVKFATLRSAGPIFEINVESYRRRSALDRHRGPGLPPLGAGLKATPKGGTINSID